MHLTSTKAPIDVFLCPDENAAESPVKNGNCVVKGDTSPFMKVLDGELKMVWRAVFFSNAFKHKGLRSILHCIC